MKFSLIVQFTFICGISIHSTSAAERVISNIIGIDETNVEFEFYSNQHPNKSIALVPGNLNNYNLDPSLPIKVIIHGYTHNAFVPWILKMKDEYFIKGKYNVIAVDWSGPANAIYPLSVLYTRDVGKFIGKLLIELNELIGVSYKNMHLIGHSLGAHVAAFAGQFVINNIGSRIGRITGMDPAGPAFLTATEDERLSPGDADFVDIIHTDRGKLGYINELGHVDFYPNGGTAPQPGCFSRSNAIEFVSCSHIRAYYLYSETINSIGFISRQCLNMFNYVNGQCESNKSAIMGENVDLSTKGRYYLTTNGATPYARNGKI